MNERIAQAEEDMRACIESSDFEAAHCDADKILLRELRALGFGDLCDLWEEVGKWYA